MCIHISIDGQNFVFENVFNESRQLVIKGIDVILKHKDLRSILTPLMAAWTEFFHADADNKCPSVTGNIVFLFLFFMDISVFLYIYDVYILLGCRHCNLR